MNPGPAPTMLNDWTSVPLFGLIFWAAVIAGVIFVIKEIRQEIHESREVLSQQRLDALTDKQWEATGCTIEDCPNIGVQLLPARIGFIWVCHRHAPAATQWTGPAVYDQQTDVSEWEREIGA